MNWKFIQTALCHAYTVRQPCPTKRAISVSGHENCPHHLNLVLPGRETVALFPYVSLFASLALPDFLTNIEIPSTETSRARSTRFEGSQKNTFLIRTLHHLPQSKFECWSLPAVFQSSRRPQQHLPLATVLVTVADHADVCSLAIVMLFHAYTVRQPRPTKRKMHPTDPLQLVGLHTSSKLDQCPHASEPDDADSHTPAACLTNGDCFLSGCSLTCTDTSPTIIVGGNFVGGAFRIPFRISSSFVSYLCLIYFCNMLHPFCPHVFPSFFT